MNLGIRAWVEIVGSALLACLLVFIAVEYHRQALTDAKATATIAAQEDAKKQIDKAIADRDAKYKVDVQAIADQRQAVAKMTTQQIVVKVPQYIPNLPAPVVAVTAETPPPQVGDVIIPEADVKPMALHELDAQQCTLDLAKCKQDEGDTEQKLDLTLSQLKTSETARKGGTLWQRVRHDAKVVGIAAALGAAAGYVAHK